MGSNTISRLLVIGVLLLFWVKSIRSQSQDFNDQTWPDVSTPCLCRNRYYKFCPSDCKSNSNTGLPDPVTITSRPITVIDRSTKSSHSFHPDHVEESSGEVGNIESFRGDTESYSKSDSLRGGGTIVRHRKVYVSDNNDKFDAPIHAIEITIPVKVKDEPVDDLPPPKPVFRMHKYTTVETKPQVEMVPVTTTIIRPVGVSKEQIIDDESSE